MAKKKRTFRGDGTFSYKDNGKVEYRICYKDENEKPRRKSFTGKDEEECENKADAFLKALEILKTGVDRDATIPELVEQRFKADFEKNYVGEQGYSRNMETLVVIKKSMIGDIPIAELTESILIYF